MLLPRKFTNIILASALIGFVALKEAQSNEINEISSRQIQDQTVEFLQSQNLIKRDESSEFTIENLTERDPKSHHRSRKHHKHKHGKHRSKHHNAKHHKVKHSKQTDKSDYTKNQHPSKKGKPSMTPNGVKAGIAGGQSLPFIRNSIGWLTEWTPNPYGPINSDRVSFASMMWGIGETGHDDDRQRFEEFKKLPVGKYKYVIGMNEADFQGGGSSGVIPTGRAAEAWDKYIAPHGHAGALLVSPSCAKQQDETWMGPFLEKVKTKPDVVNVHIFKNKASEIKPVLDHYAKYGYPMWVTELACINYSNGAHGLCSQQDADEFVREAIQILEADDRVKAYAWSDADNGPACTLTKNNGKALSQTGQTLKNVFSKFAKRDSEDI